MTTPMWPASGKDAEHHGRLDIRYEKGETPAQYGIARRDANGRLEFLCEHSWSMSWETNIAGVSVNPRRLEDLNDDCFIINFRKDSSPVTLGPKSSKYNYVIRYK